MASSTDGLVSFAQTPLPGGVVPATAVAVDGNSFGYAVVASTAMIYSGSLGFAPFATFANLTAASQLNGAGLFASMTMNF